MKPLRSLAGLFGISLMMSCFSVGDFPVWPSPQASTASATLEHAGEPNDESSDAATIKNIPVCIATRKWSAGELGQTVLYRYQREGAKLNVGYFVYWTTERPWGKNALTYSVLPALVIDAFYSHLFFMFPGAQRFVHGPGDIEGARVTYEKDANGRWVPVRAVADDGFHDEVELDRNDFVDDRGRVVLMTNVWSHQLGAKGARAFTQAHEGGLSCYDGESLSPMTDEVAGAFRLGSPSDPRRAPPAWKLDRWMSRVAVR